MFQYELCTMMSYPLSSIANGAGHECLHDATVNCLGCGIEDALEEVVGFLDLVPVEEVRLR